MRTQIIIGTLTLNKVNLGHAARALAAGAQVYLSNGCSMEVSKCISVRQARKCLMRFRSNWSDNNDLLLPQ